MGQCLQAAFDDTAGVRVALDPIIGRQIDVVQQVKPVAAVGDDGLWPAAGR